MAIRREVDESADVNSLSNVLNSMSKSGAALDFDGKPIALQILKADRSTLKILSQKIKHVADKEIAHATSTVLAQTERPTFEELFECIDAFESIAIKYRALLTGTGILTRDDGSTINVRLAGAALDRRQ